MDLALAILILSVASLLAAFLLLLVGLVYSELMNSDIPRGVACRGKLHLLHGLFVGVAVVGRILHRLGICDQIAFTRWVRERLLTSRRPVGPRLRVKDLVWEGVPVRFYEPTAPSVGLRRALVYFHGGGWVMGSIDSVDEVCRHICIHSETVVLSVGYRLAPEHPYPAPLDDCERATRYFLSVSKVEFCVDPQRVAVGGDSAGGNLAAALCLRLAGLKESSVLLPCAQLLIYPALQMANFSLPSYLQNGAVPLLFRSRATFYFLQYICGDARACRDVMEGRHVPVELRQRYHRWLSFPDGPVVEEQELPPPDGELYHLLRAGLEPEVSPLLAPNHVLRQAPPAFILTCEYDVLRDDGFLYRCRLQQLGVPVTWHHVPDGFHGLVSYLNMNCLSFPNAAKALEPVVAYMRTL